MCCTDILTDTGYEKTVRFIGGYVGADAVGGWRFCPEFAAGVGVGAESVLFSSMQIPVYLHLRSDIMGTRVSPYIALNIGYNFELKHLDAMNNLSGFFAAPSLGVSYNVGSLRMTTGLEFRFQRAVGKVGSFFDEKAGRVINAGLLGLNVGIMF